jgi:predicted ester cyclase
MSAENKAFIRRYIDEVWNRRNLNIIDEVFAPNAVLYAPPSSYHGPEGVRQYIELFCVAFPDIQVTAEDVFAEGEKVALRWSAQGTHRGEMMGIAPTGKQVTMTGQAIYRITGGKIEEAWSHGDALGMLQQFGVTPHQ